MSNTMPPQTATRLRIKGVDGCLIIILNDTLNMFSDTSGYTFGRTRFPLWPPLPSAVDFLNRVFDGGEEADQTRNERDNASNGCTPKKTSIQHTI